MITKGFSQIPKEIAQMDLDELRKQLVANAMSYKGEKLRNQTFERKLGLAIKQFSRREEVI